jgi:hypothetical protein
MVKSKFPSCFRIFPNYFIRNSELYSESPADDMWSYYAEKDAEIWTLSFFRSEKVRKFELCNFLCCKKCGKLDFIIFIGKIISFGIPNSIRNLLLTICGRIMIGFIVVVVRQ